MNKKILKIIGYSLLFGGILALFIWLIVQFNKSSSCKSDSDCKSGQKCQNDECVTAGGCTPSCGTDMYCEGNKCIPDRDYPPITDQPENTVQLANSTSEDFLHIFIQCTNVNQKWKNVGGKGTIADPVNWGTANPKGGNYAWNPPGAVILAEAIIPKNGYIILQLPDDVSTFIMQPIKMKKSDNNTPLKLGDDIYSIIMKQSSLLFEATVNEQQSGVADISGVNGVNFKVKYSVTTDKGVENMEIQKNPCARISDEFKMEVGCWSPVKQICGNSPTADCKPGTQNCKFNKCSTTLFDIDSHPDLKQYKRKYDDAGGHVSPYNDYAKYPEYVKKFINQNKNLKQGSDQDKYCDDIQFNSRDYTTYCYDYNDLGSSPIWKKPYKAKLVYFDL